MEQANTGANDKDVGTPAEQPLGSLVAAGGIATKAPAGEPMMSAEQMAPIPVATLAQVPGQDPSAAQGSPVVTGGLMGQPVMGQPVMGQPVMGQPMMGQPGLNPDGPEGTVLPVKQPLDLKHERLQGTVAKYVPTNGWGFVKSHMFEGELFFRSERIMPEFQGHPLHEGEAVEFDVQAPVRADDHGKPQAVALKPVLGRKPYECLGQRHRGYVRRFAERWGFLNAAAFDGDLFVHRDNLLPVPDQLTDGQPLLRAGQAVEFDVALDDRGRAVAKQITTRALLRPCDWIGHRLRGYIRSFQGAWGFINSDRFAGDLFVHRDSLLAQCQTAQLAVGTIVEFDVERDHHRKGAKNRLVARHVAVLGPGDAVTQQQPAYSTLPPPQQQMHGAPLPQALPMDPAAYSTLPPSQPLPPGYPGALNPGAASFAPQTSPLYYPQGTQPTHGLMPDQQLGTVGYGHQYPYAQPQFPMQPMLPPQQHQLPPQYAQQPYAPQPQYGQPYPPQPQYQQQPVPQVPQMPQPQPQPMGPMATTAAPPMVHPQPQAYLPPGVTPANDEQQRAAAQAAAAAAAAPGVPAQGNGAAVPVAEGQSQGLLHITMHDWEPDQNGQLFVTKGTLVNVSYRAAHGWVYAGTVQPGNETGEPATEGWIPQAVVKRVSLCRVAIDWPAEGSGTLGVQKSEIIAVSKEAERGWVYGERIGPRQPDRPSDGWLPKKVLDYLQS